MNDTTLTILKNKLHLKNITVIGAVGNCLPRVFVMTATSTNGVNFKRFLEALAEKTRHLRRRPILVLDNHAAHKAKINQPLLQKHFQVEFQPAYSSPMNNTETVWSVIK